MREVLSRRRRVLLDWVGPLGILAVGLVDISMHPHSRQFPGQPWQHALFLAAAAVTLGLRRRAPVAAPGITIAIATAWASMWSAGAQGPFEGFVLLVAAAYAIGSGNAGRGLRLASALLVGFFAASQVVMLITGDSLGDFLPVLIWMSAAWGVGLLLNRRSAEATQARAAAQTLLVEQERRTAEAVEQERSRIARELHDVVAHSLSVIVVQSAAERRAISHGALDPDSVEGVLASVEKTGREALVDLRRLLGLLRQVDEAPALAPQPSLAQLDTLVETARESGLDVEVVVDGDAPDLPAGVDLTAYRIIQESLTNVRKHARASRVQIELRYRTRSLELTVSDDGRGDPGWGLGGSGHGLLGMRERAHVFGGTVTAGPRTEGGWVVSVRLPLEPAALEPA